MNAMLSPEWQDFQRLRFLGKYSALPAHVQTQVSRIILAELRAVGLLTDVEMVLLHDKAHKAKWELQYKQHQREQIADWSWDKDQPEARLHAIEARISELEQTLASFRDQSRSTGRRSPASGLRSLLRRLAGGR